MGKGLGILLIIIGGIIVLFFGAIIFGVLSLIAAGTHYIGNWGMYVVIIFIFLAGIGLIIAGIKSMKS